MTRAGFVSLAYYPTEDMVGADGRPFRPGPFARTYLTLDLPVSRTYGYADFQLTGAHSFGVELITLDGGLAARPWTAAPRF